MNWLIQWKALSDRTAGVIEAGNIYLHGLISGTDDPYSTAKKQLLPRFHRLFEEMETFAAQHGSVLPPLALVILREFLDENRSLLTSPAMTPPATVKSALPALLSAQEGS